jgi:hypothetical protein
MVDPPFEYCPVCRESVLLNQSQQRCAREYDCKALSTCVLRARFTGIEFREACAARRLKMKERNTLD